MKRRAFIKGAAAGSAGAALVAPAIVRGQEQVKWRLASSFPKTLDTLFGASELVSKRVSAATGGKFDIRVFAAGEIVPPLGVVDAVQQGNVECCHTSAYFFFGKDPTFAFDTGISYGMNARQMTAWSYDGGGMQLMREFYRDYNIVQFPCANTGAQPAGWFRKEVKSLDDLKGLKMRIGGFAGTVIERLGVIPQNIPPGDIYTALEKGTIDAAEYVGPYDDEKLGLHKIAKFYYYPAFWEGGSQLVLYVNTKAWDGLSKEYQAILESACAEAHVLTLAKYDARNPPALKRLVAGGAQLRPLPRPVLEAGWKAANELYAELSAKNPKWKKVYESHVKFRDDLILWFRFAEGGFDTFMASIKRG
jgi:TRAP-type mannitol/chloroaromatic compound transport system substrate-binding protein